MRPEDRDAASLWQMLEAAREVVSFVAGASRADYGHDRKLRRAVERSVEIIGEAARRVSRAFQDAHPQIPWNKIVVQRHRLAHEYDAIDDDLIWLVATKHVPVLIAELEKVGLIPPAETPGPEAAPSSQSAEPTPAPKPSMDAK